MAVDLEIVAASGVPSIQDQVVAVYRDLFPMPPYGETAEDIAGFAARLPRHAARDGFRGAVAREEGEPLGFADGHVGAPGRWWHDLVWAALGPGIAARWLVGAFALVELAVVPAAQGRGIGGRLHDAVFGGTSARTEVTSTPRDGNPAVRFYRRRGWHAVHDAVFYPNGATPHLVLGRDLGPPADRPSA